MKYRSFDPSDEFRFHSGVYAWLETRYLWLMQWNWSWKDVVIFAVVTISVAALVYTKHLPSETFVTLILGALIKQPVKGFGQVVKDSLRPPPPEAKP